MPRRTNVLFEETVRGAYFNLSLARTHIQALAYVFWDIKPAVFAHWISAIKATRLKGLTLHSEKGFTGNGQKLTAPLSEHYRLTKAGEYTVGLLIEAGMISRKPPKALLDAEAEHQRRMGVAEVVRVETRRKVLDAAG